MATSERPEERQSRTGQLVEEAKIEMYMARSQYRRAKKRNQVTLAIRADLADALEDYYDALWEYADKNQQIKQAWEDSGVDAIQELSRQSVEVPTAAPGRGGNAETKTQNATVRTDPERLVALSKKLDYFANALGFGKEVDQGRPFGRIGSDEMWAEASDEQ